MRRTSLLLSLSFASFLVGCAGKQAGSPAYAVSHAPESAENHRAAALRLFEAARMAELIEKSLIAMVQAQIELQPSLAPFEEDFLAFFRQYMSWESLEEVMLAKYTETFSQRELEEITAFYLTATGQRAIEEMPALTAFGSTLGQQRVQAHMHELHELLERRSAELAAEGEEQP